jgi:hypothetical protein
MHEDKPTTAAPDVQPNSTADGDMPSGADLRKMLQGEGNRKQRRKNAALGIEIYRRHLRKRSRTKPNAG